MTEPILAFPDFSLPIILHTDAVNFGLGAVLAQEHRDEEDKPLKRVVAYASRALHGTEKTYAPTHKEALAVRWAVEKFRPYLIGRRFQILTDHRARSAHRNGQGQHGAAGALVPVPEGVRLLHQVQAGPPQHQRGPAEPAALRAHGGPVVGGRAGAWT